MLPVAVANARGRSFRWRQRSARRPRFGIGRAWKSTGLGVRRWSLEPKNVRRQRARRFDFPFVNTLRRARLHGLVTRRLVSVDGEVLGVMAQGISILAIERTMWTIAITKVRFKL